MDKNPEEIVFSWWRDLDNARFKRRDIQGQIIYTPYTRGDSAEIRRCKTLEEVLIQAPVMYDLKNRLDQTKWKNTEQIALVAGILSHVKNATKKAMPEMLATLAGAKESAIKLRFQRLIQYQSRDEIFRPMHRMVKYLDGATNVGDLATALYFWGEDTRKNWVIAFYKNLKK